MFICLKAQTMQTYCSYANTNKRNLIGMIHIYSVIYIQKTAQQVQETNK